MTDFGIGSLVLACVFGGALAGMLLGRLLPPHHLGDETRSVVTLALGTLSVLSALVLGLLISFAKGDFDAQTKVVQGFAADLILLDRVLRQYGPETSEARDLLRRYTALKIALTWPEENARVGPRLDDPAALAMLEGVQAKLLELAPGTRRSAGCSRARCRSAATSPRSAGCWRPRTRARSRGPSSPSWCSGWPSCSPASACSRRATPPSWRRCSCARCPCPPRSS